MYAPQKFANELTIQSQSQAHFHDAGKSIFTQNLANLAGKDLLPYYCFAFMYPPRNAHK
jgi:hypothetical protein